MTMICVDEYQLLTLINDNNDSQCIYSVGKAYRCREQWTMGKERVEMGNQPTKHK
jgi:hypothetical protein